MIPVDNKEGLSMSRFPRNTSPEFIRHVSIRVDNACLRMVPSQQVTEIVGGVLAKYQVAFGIELFAYCFLSNHFHLLLRAPRGNLWRFMQAVNREIAKRINRLLNRRGHFWERRYDEQIVAEDEDAIEAFLYVICNPVSHGLVNHPKHWPGLTAYEHVLDEKDRFFQFADYTAYRKAKLKAKMTGDTVRLEDFKKTYQLQISPLPVFADLSPKKRREKLGSLLEQRTQELRKLRQRHGKEFLGKEKILRQHPNATPRQVKRLPRPICYTKNIEVKKRFLEWFMPWLKWYQEASQKFRMGKLLTKFPKHCIRPALLYCIDSP